MQQPGIQLSVDEKGACRDNRFVERLWKCVTREEVYRHAYDSVPEARHGLTRYCPFSNQGRPHTALDGQTPDMVYFAPLPQREAE